MPKGSMSSDDKWKYSVIAGILFFVIANPHVYKAVDKIVGSVLGKTIGKIAGPGGCPTMVGLIVHSVVYILATRLLMDAK